jgi:hypothetical protein
LGLAGKENWLMAEDRILSDAEMIALGRRIAAELGYIRGLIDTIRTAPGEVDVTVFLDRFERAVAALEAVEGSAERWGVPAARERPETDLTRGVIIAIGAVTQDIVKDIASALLIEVPGSPSGEPTDTDGGGHA